MTGTIKQRQCLDEEWGTQGRMTAKDKGKACSDASISPGM